MTPPEHLASLRIARVAAARTRAGPTARRCDELVATPRVFARLAAPRPRDLGVREVPLDRIVGSAGRERDFDLAFRPRHARARARLAAVVRALARRPLPPVELLRVGDALLVEDGHHRVAAARAAGRATILARVVELAPDGLEPRAACSRLGFGLEPGPCRRVR